jgi:hypothetical protein
MEDRIDLGTWRDRILEILISLRAFFRIATSEQSPFLGPTRIYQRSESRAVLQIPWDPRMGSDALRAMILSAIAGNSSATEPAARFGAERLYFWKGHLQQFMGWTEGSSRRDVPLARAEYEVVQAQIAIWDLIVLGAKLRAEPILVDSGQWETLLERPRAFADVREEVANSLVKQPRFHALCRVTRDGKVFQHWIETPRFEVLDEAHRFSDVESIRSRSRQEHAKPRAVVETERLARRARFSTAGTTRSVHLGADETEPQGG